MQVPYQSVLKEAPSKWRKIQVAQAEPHGHTPVLQRAHQAPRRRNGLKRKKVAGYSFGVQQSGKGPANPSTSLDKCLAKAFTSLNHTE